MALITIPADKLNKVLFDVEVLIEDVASLLNQDEIAKKRLVDIKTNPSISTSEEELDNYLRIRGIKIDRMDNKTSS
ncbi:hypothetical protein HYV50_02635 [Candidatus Pacearchaeota archaeon]|nr:hypothetical protein [Candidatus Pacearchaeota archaeon]